MCEWGIRVGGGYEHVVGDQRVVGVSMCKCVCACVCLQDMLVGECEQLVFVCACIYSAAEQESKTLVFVH